MARRLVLAFCFAASVAAGLPASAQDVSLDSLRAEQQALLGDLEINLQLMETNEMRMQQLNVRADGHRANATALDAEIRRSNEYCTGEYEEPEYSRRVAQCSTWQGGLNARARDLDYEREGLERQAEEIIASEERRSDAATGLLESLNASVGRSIILCSTLSARARAMACNGPAPAGPRTSEIYAELQAIFDRLSKECAGLSLDLEVECNRRLFDGTNYDPGRPPLPDPHN